MPAGQRPLVRRRLRLELREERERAGKSQNEVAHEMDWSISKIIRLEAGQVGISTNDLKALLDLYEISDTERRTFLVQLARAARDQSAWWNAYRDVLPSPDYQDFLGYEFDASALNAYTPLIIPGLLQTEEYAREIIRTGSLDPTDETTLDRLIQLRMARKQRVLDRDDPPTLTAILDEAVLRRCVGGGEAMSEQLSSMAEVATLDNVTVQVIPFERGAHLGLVGAFEILEFADPADTPVLQFDAAPRNVVLRDDPTSVETYRATYEHLQSLALSEAESIQLISKVADQMLEVGDYTE